MPDTPGRVFLNADLEVVSRARLDPLAAELGDAVTVLHCGPARGRHLLVLESARQHRTPDAAIAALCAAVEGLSPSGRRRWDRARRTFDVGYELPAGATPSGVVLRPATVARVATLGAALAVTVYPPESLPST